MPVDDGCRIVGYAFLLAALMVLCLHLVFRKGTGEAPGHGVILTPRGPFILASGNGETDFAKLQAKPNILIVIADDMGYSDLASYGNPARQENYIDNLAASGIRFQSVYSADSLCTPSRAGLLTGRLPVRNGMIAYDGGFRVGAPTDTGGLQPEEVTIPEVLKTVDYRTGMVGKWHLGINEKTDTDGKYLPSKQGFDFVGVNLPMTNNRNCDESKYWQPDGPSNWMCFLYNDTQIIQQPINFTGLTDHLLTDFNRFLDQQKEDQPFFFYFSFPQMHDALFSWKSGWDKKSETGLYGGDMLEMADAIEKIMANLKSRGIADDTLVVFMSDHGPHVELCQMGGATPFKGAELPKVELDGSDQRRAFFQADHTVGKRPIFYYCNEMLMAVRLGAYKVHFRTIGPMTESSQGPNCPNGLPLKDMYTRTVMVCGVNNTDVQNPPVVYQILQDPGERWPLGPEKIPENLKTELSKIIAEHEQSLKVDKREPQLGKFKFMVGPCCDPPRCKCNYDGPSVPLVSTTDHKRQMWVMD